ncbi:MAG: hypothetical protein ACRDL0_09365 [Thermoleophilaceae bacterium]
MNAAVVIVGGVLVLGAASGGSDTATAAGPAEPGTTGIYPTLAGLVEDAGFPRHHHDDMVAIAMAESSGRLDVVSAPNRNGTRDRCAWQINDVHGYDRSRLINDPSYCAAAAREVYHRQGLGAWTVYNTGAYRQYLGAARAAVDR